MLLCLPLRVKASIRRLLKSPEVVDGPQSSRLRRSDLILKNFKDSSLHNKFWQLNLNRKLPKKHPPETLGWLWVNLKLLASWENVSGTRASSNRLRPNRLTRVPPWCMPHLLKSASESTKINYRGLIIPSWPITMTLMFGIKMTSRQNLGLE